ncbi:MAG: UDP-glucuronate 5-epimerase, partial [Pseudomonadota bacterium]
AILEDLTGRTAETEMLPMQPGDVEATAADTAALEAKIAFRPSTPLETGLARFVAWYRQYHQC